MDSKITLVNSFEISQSAIRSLINNRNLQIRIKKLDKRMDVGVILPEVIVQPQFEAPKKEYKLKNTKIQRQTLALNENEILLLS